MAEDSTRQGHLETAFTQPRDTMAVSDDEMMTSIYVFYILHLPTYLSVFMQESPRRNEIHDLMNIHEQFMNIHELFMNGNHIWFMN